MLMTGARARVDRIDRLGDGAARLAREAGAEQRVDDRGAASEHIADAPRALGGAPARAVQAQRLLAGETLEVDTGVAAVVVGGARADDGDGAPGLAQQARDDEAVATVVALSTDHRDRPVGDGALDGPYDAGARPLHQLKPRDPLLLDRPAIDRAHLLGVGQRDQPVGQRAHRRDASGRDGVRDRDPGARRRAGDYSTVTVFARLRG